jgi:hypothetical protein
LVRRTAEQIFTSSDIWTKPSGVKTIEVIAAGGGSTGVGAGAFVKQTMDVSAQTSIPVTVGAAGGTTKFGTLNLLAGGTNQGDWFDTGKSGSYFYTVGNGVFGFRQNTVNNEGSMSFGNGIYVTVGTEYYGGEQYARAAISTDATSWTSTVNMSLGTGYPNAYGWQGVAFGGGKFVALFGATAYWSTDGITWNGVLGLPTAGGGQYRISYVGNRWFVGNGENFYGSADGVSWSLVLSTAGGSNAKVAWNGTYYVILMGNYGGQAFRSTDGVSFSAISQSNNPNSSSHQSNMNNFTAFGGYFIFTIQQAGFTYCLISTDGGSWSQWNSVYGGASGNGGQVVVTPTRIYFQNSATSTLYYATSVGGAVTAAGNKGGGMFAQPNGEQVLWAASNTAIYGGFALGRTGNQGLAAAGGGAGSAGYLIGTGMNTPGTGIDGWCNGSNTTMTYAGTQSWGSAKNQGAVLVRWMA